MTLRRASGFTLMEMIAIIVVVSIVLVALLGVFNTSVFRSADPMIRMQAIAIAQGYLEEALLKEYEDPQNPAGEPACEAGEIRETYDDVQDYICVTGEAPVDQFGNDVTELNAYTVIMNVAATTLGSPPANVIQVTVTVTHPTMPSGIQLIGHRGQY